MPKTTQLSSNYTVAQYQGLETAQPPNKDEIAKFFVERFTERYITPIKAADKKKHGFCTMAVSCLLVEALESFWCGWPKTERGNSPLAFCQFFSRCRRFHSLLGHAPDFYKHVRCGILHQAETTGGWTISRHKDALLFDPSGPSINATKFHEALSFEITDYADLLKSSDWNSECWRKFRTKMKAICKNC